MKTFLKAFFLTTIKAATLTSSFLLFNEGCRANDNLLVVLSWIMFAYFLAFVSFSWIISQPKA